MAVPVGETFEEPLLVPSRIVLGSMYNPFHTEFYMELKIILPQTKNGFTWNQKEFSYSMWTAEGTQNNYTWNQKVFYLEPKKVLLTGQLKNPLGILFSKSVYKYSRISHIWVISQLPLLID